MRFPVLALAAVLLAAGCHSAAKRPVASVTPTPSPTTASDPYADLTPPDSPGVGSYDPLVANHAYAAVHGYLATQLLEPATLLGTGDPAVVAELTGVSGDTTAAGALGRVPSRKGLSYRPRFAPGTTLQPSPIKVADTVYTADPVQGLAGEKALRISWTGTIDYAVVEGGKPFTVAYTTSFAYIFSTLANDPSGVALQAIAPGAFTATQVRTSCLDKGLLLPSATPGGACPL